MRRLALLGMLLVLALLTAGFSSAGQGLGQIKGVYFIETSGALSNVHKGQPVYYTFGVGSNGNSKLSSVRVDLYLPKQAIIPGSLSLGKSASMTQLSRPQIVGQHIRMTVGNVPARMGFQITVNTKVMKSASGQLCVKMLVTVGGDQGDYSYPCVRIINSPL